MYTSKFFVNYPVDVNICDIDAQYKMRALSLELYKNILATAPALLLIGLPPKMVKSRAQTWQWSLIGGIPLSRYQES